MNRGAFQIVFKRQPDKWWAVKELASVLGVDENTIYTAIKDGSLPHYRVGAAIRIAGGEIADWLECSITRTAEGRIVCSTTRLTTT